MGCCRVYLAVALALLPSVMARMVFMDPQLLRQKREELPIKQEARMQMVERIEDYVRYGVFPRAGRSIAEKKSEIEHFLAREMAKSELIGLSAAVVYQDEVLHQKGYGLQRFGPRCKTLRCFKSGR